MWTNLSKRASSRKFKLSSESFYIPSSSSPRKFPQHPNFPGKIRAPENQTKVNSWYPFLDFNQAGVFTSINELGRSKFLFSEDPLDFYSSLKRARGYACVVEAIESSDTEDDCSGSDEIQKLLEEMVKEENGKPKLEHQKNMREGGGMASYKYKMLRRRQIKVETEAWEEAAREYQELLDDMREQKLAPNLPYMKSLFLGWFEPLRNAISVDQELCKESKNRMSHASYFNQLPAEMMAVITMHKLMGLLLTNSNGIGSARVIQAACQIGEAIEHEARIYRFMEKTNKAKQKRSTTDNPDGKSDLAPSERGNMIEEKEKMVKEQLRLRKKVASLVNKQKKQQAMGIVRGLDDWKPWGQEAQVKVGSRLVQLLIETAYMQPPANQFGDGPPDIQPAFTHTLKTVSTDPQRGSRRYGVIECDPLVQKGLDKTARHVVIPYMPMLVPPINWTGQCF